MDLQKLFEQSRKKQVAQITASSEKKNFSNENFIDFKPGNTYSFRLIYYVPKGRAYTDPFAINYIHRIKLERGASEIMCPTSNHIDGQNGFKKCKVCEAVSSFYKEGQAGSGSSKDLYSTFRRRFHGYAMVYVVKDPLKPENDGTVKLIHFNTDMYAWLMREIYGIDVKSKKELVLAEEPIGAKAFDLDDGYNFIVTVSQKDKYNAYACGWSKRTSAITVTEDTIAKAYDELNFEFYLRNSTQSEIESFYNQHVVRETVVSDMKKETAKVEEAKPSPVETKEEIPSVFSSVSTHDEEEVNIDDILATINQ